MSLQPITLKIEPEQQVQIQVILMDQDGAAALEMLKSLYQSVQASSNLGMRSHLDRQAN